MSNIAILAFGSLIEDPGEEIGPLIRDRVEGVRTPFSIEFARRSRTRGGGPTLIPVDDGGSRLSVPLLPERPARSVRWRGTALLVRAGNGCSWAPLGSPISPSTRAAPIPPHRPGTPSQARRVHHPREGVATGHSLLHCFPSAFVPFRPRAPNEAGQAAT